MTIDREVANVFRSAIFMVIVAASTAEGKNYFITNQEFKSLITGKTLS